MCERDTTFPVLLDLEHVSIRDDKILFLGCLLRLSVAPQWLRKLQPHEVTAGDVYISLRHQYTKGKEMMGDAVMIV